MEDPSPVTEQRPSPIREADVGSETQFAHERQADSKGEASRNIQEGARQEQITAGVQVVGNSGASQMSVVAEGEQMAEAASRAGDEDESDGGESGNGRSDDEVEDDLGNDSEASSNWDSGGSWHSDEYPALELNYDALKHIARYYLPGDHGKCIDITIIGRGSFHEVRTLHFEDGWTCIGRFARDRMENVAVTESELATREYVLKHTSIRVPQTYHVNLDPTNAVGAPFVLMEHIEGHHLYKMWKGLKTEYRSSVLAELADVLAQLVRLRFDKIGALKLGGVVGPLQNPTIPEHEPGRGPWSTTIDYMLSFLSENASRQPKTQADNATLQPPYRLIHGDFDAQNLSFIWESPSQRPRLSGIIDWDYSYTGPLYNLCEYPIFIIDNDAQDYLYDENKLLRKEFAVRDCFRRKTYALNGFSNIFATHSWSDPDLEVMMVKDYLEQLRAMNAGEETLPAYNGRSDYEPDSELESDDGGQ